MAVIACMLAIRGALGLAEMAEARDRSGTGRDVPVCGPPRRIARDHDSEALHHSESHGAPPVVAAQSSAADDDDDGVEGLSDRLARDLRRATTEQQRLDAIASLLFAANALWRDSDARRPQRAFGFRVLRTMPSAAESLQMRGEGV
ncbi:unnamed protein product [Closterium sp. Yama58-4]|nr:unnamed protein product [Closterium sp. Yama58-4]